MAPIILAGYVISVLSGVVHLGTDVLGFDMTLRQDRAELSTLVVPAGPLPPLAAAPPTLPLCPKMTATMDDSALNVISLMNARGACRHGTQ
jgi:hypothetical protein